MLKIKLKIKELLKERGVTQMELSGLTGIAQARVSKLCSPNRQEVNLEMLEKIANKLEITDISLLIDFVPAENDRAK
ncbi:helix-turn-helix transcriptional regulator [Paenibacillus sp. FSL E2-0274]|uniref:helix-turn-helix domain-containing protein n=1 Tax=Paenibacillus TaxID=44249 RepID=UPI00096EB423|nr:helix-turn-helix transcriptional regulator [Paenibacillus odorifer]OME31778.1 transcriptional regulator [Paenibacillus odorifer]OME37902.1 transcriptional regulator [Paenibacillus odorifer]